jgi:DNA-binding SARP family transcriptional activator
MDMQTQTAPLQIRLFGSMEVRLEGKPLPKTRTRKERWLLAILALARGQEIPCLAISQALWPEEDRFPLDPGYNLRRSLADLRRALGPQAYRLHSAEPQTLRLDLPDAEVDIVAIDNRLGRQEMSVREKVDALTALYQGPLLPECTEEWADTPRERFRLRYHRALLTLGEQALQEGELRTAIFCFRQAASEDRGSLRCSS